MQKIKEIHQSVPEILSENLSKHYDARHMHHIECIMDGIVKARCFLDNDMSFKAKEEDYKLLEEVWMNIIGSWLNVDQIRRVPLEKRIFFLPENSQYLYWKVCEEKRALNKEEVKEIAMKAMDKSQYYESWGILVDMGLMIESDGLARPHYISEIKDGNQSRL